MASIRFWCGARRLVWRRTHTDAAARVRKNSSIYIYSRRPNHTRARKRLSAGPNTMSYTHRLGSVSRFTTQSLPTMVTSWAVVNPYLT